MSDLFDGHVAQVTDQGAFGRAMDAAMARTLSYRRIENDFYATIEADAVVPALLRWFPLRDEVWEPSAGQGHLVRALVAAGHSVVATDLYAYPPIDGAPSIAAGFDFLRQEFAPYGVRAIVMNPPYDAAQRHVERARMLMLPARGVVCAFLRSEFAHSKRAGILFDRPDYAGRVDLRWRPRWIEGTTGSPRHNYAWFVWSWDRTNLESPPVHRFADRPPKRPFAKL